MKFLVDANLSPTVARLLRDAGFDTTHVGETGLLTATDAEISAHARANDAIIISADSDFATLLALSGHLTPSLVPLRSSDHLTPAEQAAILCSNLPHVIPNLLTGGRVLLARPHSGAEPAAVELDPGTPAPVPLNAEWRSARLARML